MSSILSSPLRRVADEAPKYFDKAYENHSKIKDCLQIVHKIFEGYYVVKCGKMIDRVVPRSMGKVIKGLAIVGTIKNVLFWVNPFSRGTLDKVAFQDSLKTIVDEKNKKSLQQDEVKRVMDEVLQTRFYSKREVYRRVRESLKKRGIVFFRIDTLKLKKQKRSLYQFVTKTCFTIASVGGTFLTLKEWGVLREVGITPLSRAAAKIGNRFPVFRFMSKVSLGTVLGGFAALGLAISFAHDIQELILARKKTSKESVMTLMSPSEKRKKALISLIDNGVDLAATALPLFLILNPLLGISLAIFSKSVGMVCFFLKK